MTDDLDRLRALAAAVQDAMHAVADLLRTIIEALAAWIAKYWPIIERALKVTGRFRAFQRHKPIRPQWALWRRHASRQPP